MGPHNPDKRWIPPVPAVRIPFCRSSVPWLPWVSVAALQGWRPRPEQGWIPRASSPVCPDVAAGSWDGGAAETAAAGGQDKAPAQMLPCKRAQREWVLLSVPPEQLSVS